MSDTPDWSQVATKDDLSQLESRLTQSMSRLEQHIDRISDRLVWWLVGISLTFLVLLGGMVTPDRQAPGPCITSFPRRG